MLIKVQTDLGNTCVLNTDNVCRVVDDIGKAVVTQACGTSIRIRLTVDQYFNLVNQSTEMEQHENSKRLAKQLRALL